MSTHLLVFVLLPAVWNVVACFESCELFPLLHNVIYEEPYQLYCRVLQGNASSYRIDLLLPDSTRLEVGHYTEQVNATFLKLLLYPITEADFEGSKITALCYNSEDKSQLCFDFLLFGYRPSEMKLDRTGTVLYNWEDLDIVFQAVSNFTGFKTTYQVMYKRSDHDAPFLNCSMSLNNYSCTAKNILTQVNEDGWIFVQVVGSNVADSFSSVLIPLQLFDIARPGFVRNVTFTGSSPYQEEMCFVPPNLRYAFLTKYLVQYKCVVTSKFIEMWLDNSSMAHRPNGRRCVVLAKLWPASQYIVTIQAFSLPKNISGPIYTSEFTSAETVPLRHLIITEGSFDVVSRNSSTQTITVYWQNMAREYQGGRLVAIEVEYICGAISHTVSKSYTGLPWVELAGIPSDKDCLIFLMPATQQGYNVTLRRKLKGLFIPVTKPSRPDNFTVIFEGNGSLSVYWNTSGISSPTIVTAFFCTGLRDCQGHVTWIKVPTSQQHLSFSKASIAKLGAPMRPVRVGLAVSDQDSRSTGIIWTKCIYNSQKLPGKPEIRATPYGNNKIKVEITPVSCTSNPGGFTYATNLYYCLSYNKTDCQDKVTKVTVAGTWSAVIGGLEQGQLYLLWGEGVSRMGVSMKTHPLVVLSQGALLTLSKILGITLGAGVPLLLLITCGVVKCYRWGRQCRVKFKRMFTIPVNIPKKQHSGNGDLDIQPLAYHDQNENTLLRNNLHGDVSKHLSLPSSPQGNEDYPLSLGRETSLTPDDIVMNPWIDQLVHDPAPIISQGTDKEVDSPGIENYARAGSCKGVDNKDFPTDVPACPIIIPVDDMVDGNDIGHYTKVTEAQVERLLSREEQNADLASSDEISENSEGQPNTPIPPRIISAEKNSQLPVLPGSEQNTDSQPQLLPMFPQENMDSQHQLPMLTSSPQENMDSQHQLPLLTSSPQKNMDSQHILPMLTASPQENMDSQHILPMLTASPQENMDSQHILPMLTASPQENMDSQHILPMLTASPQENMDSQHQLLPLLTSSPQENMDSQHQLPLLTSSPQENMDSQHQLPMLTSSPLENMDSQHQQVNDLCYSSTDSESNNFKWPDNPYAQGKFVEEDFGKLLHLSVPPCDILLN